MSSTILQALSIVLTNSNAISESVLQLQIRESRSSRSEWPLHFSGGGVVVAYEQIVLPLTLEAQNGIRITMHIVLMYALRACTYIRKTHPVSSLTILYVRKR